jgi:hypothetical protein
MRLCRILGIAITTWAFAAISPPSYGVEPSVVQVTVKTSWLIGHPAGPFSIAFALTDGSGLEDGKSTATVTNVNFGSGKALKVPFLVGGASGDLTSAVTITNSSVLSLFVETFTPGEELSFQVSLTAGQSKGGFPTRLTVFILDASGTPLATLAPVGDFFIGIDLTSEDPSPEVYASDPSRPPPAGNPISIPAPEIQD